MYIKIVNRIHQLSMIDKSVNLTVTKLSTFLPGQLYTEQGEQESA